MPAPRSVSAGWFDEGATGLAPMPGPSSLRPALSLTSCSGTLFSGAGEHQTQQRLCPSVVLLAGVPLCLGFAA